MPEQPNIDYTRRLELLEEHASETKSQLGEHRTILNLHSAKLEDILIAVTKRDAAPQFSLKDTLSAARDIMAMCAIVGTLSVWVISTVTGSNDDVVATKLTYMEKKLDAFEWRPVLEVNK